MSNYIGSPPNDNDTRATCPECDGPMAWRQVRATQGWFLGCAKYPKCTGSRNQDGFASRASNGRLETKLHRLLVAAILASEEECIIFTDKQLNEADNYRLDLESVDGNGYIVTVQRKPA